MGCLAGGYVLLGRINRLPFMFSDSDQKAQHHRLPKSSGSSPAEKPFQIVRNARGRPKTRKGQRKQQKEQRSIPIQTLPAPSPHDDYDESPPAAMSSHLSQSRQRPRGKQYSEASMRRREIRIRFAERTPPEQEARQAQMWKKAWLPEILDFSKKGMQDLASVFTWARLQETQQPPTKHEKPAKIEKPVKQAEFEPEQERSISHLVQIPQEEQPEPRAPEQPTHVEPQRNEYLTGYLGQLSYRYQQEFSIFIVHEESQDFFFGHPHAHQD